MNSALADCTGAIRPPLCLQNWRQHQDSFERLEKNCPISCTTETRSAGFNLQASLMAMADRSGMQSCSPTLAFGVAIRSLRFGMIPGLSRGGKYAHPSRAVHLPLPPPSHFLSHFRYRCHSQTVFLSSFLSLPPPDPLSLACGAIVCPGRASDAHSGRGAACQDRISPALQGDAGRTCEWQDSHVWHNQISTYFQRERERRFRVSGLR